MGAVNPRAHRVELAGGTCLVYDKLLVATGGIPRTFKKPIGGHGGAQMDRSLDPQAVQCAITHQSDVGEFDLLVQHPC